MDLEKNRVLMKVWIRFK